MSEWRGVPRRLVLGALLLLASCEKGGEPTAAPGSADAPVPDAASEVEAAEAGSTPGSAAAEQAEPAAGSDGEPAASEDEAADVLSSERQDGKTSVYDFDDDASPDTQFIEGVDASRIGGMNCEK